MFSSKEILCIAAVILVICILKFHCDKNSTVITKKNKEKESGDIFYSLQDYPEVLIIEEKWEDIRSEIPPLNNIDPTLIREAEPWNSKKNIAVAQRANKKLGWVSGWNPGWYHYPIAYLGKYMDGIEKICPKTVKILKLYGDQIHIAGYSVLMPDTTLPWHRDETGKTDGSIAINLPLSAENSTLYVKTDDHLHSKKQVNGKTIIFDSNYEHEVINHSNSNIRVILYVDFKIDSVVAKISDLKNVVVGKNPNQVTAKIKLHRKMDPGTYLGECETGKVVLIIPEKTDECLARFINTVPGTWVNSNIRIKNIKKMPKK